MPFFCSTPSSRILFAFYRNLCIDGGYEICAEMYNKNILAPLSTFVPKVCIMCFYNAPENCTARMTLLVYSDWAVWLTLFSLQTPRFHRFSRDISTLQKRLPRTRRRWYTNLRKTSLPFCGVSRESTIAGAAYERASASPAVPAHSVPV